MERYQDKKAVIIGGTSGMGPNGGTMPQLIFGVVGDTRPPNEDDVSGYPTAIITKLFQELEGQSPKIPFVVSSGDYQYSSTGSSSTASQQLQLVQQMRELQQLEPEQLERERQQWQ